MSIKFTKNYKKLLCHECGIVYRCEDGDRYEECPLCNLTYRFNIVAKRIEDLENDHLDKIRIFK